MDAPLAKFEMY